MENTVTLKDLIEACEAGSKEYHFCGNCFEVTAALNPGLDIQYCAYCGSNKLTRVDQHLAEYVLDEDLLDFLEKNGIK